MERKRDKKKEKENMREKERKGEKRRDEEEKDRRREKNGRIREKRKEIEKNRERKREKQMSRVNYYQYAFNSQKEKLNILAEMLKISKSGLCCGRCIIDHYHYKSSCRS